MAFNSNIFSTPISKTKNDPNLRWSRTEVNRPHRGVFSKDRDRILYSKSFLRLRGKTQVFMLQSNDYIRTRLTHTLEVNQIAKTISIALGLNAELTEAIALGHDVGHTPFGHVGERTLFELLEDDISDDNLKGFKHNLQALRLLCDLEKGADYPEVKGLNLTKYVLWGISHHSSIEKKKKDQEGNIIGIITHPIYKPYLDSIKDYWSFEALIVAIADEIAQRHHDIEDSLAYGVVDRKTIVEKLSSFQPLFGPDDRKSFAKLRDGIDALENPVFTSVFSRLVVNVYVNNTINTTRSKLKSIADRYQISNQDSFFEKREQITIDDYSKAVSFSDVLKQLDDNFQQFLMSSVLSSYQAQVMDGKGAYIIKKLYRAYKTNMCQLPDTALKSFASSINEDFNRSTIRDYVDGHEDILYRCIVDFIGGMTDQFAYDEYDRLYGTRV